MPVVQKVGPDGSLYVLDWYDRYHCYQDANRDPNGIDRLKGRLYRVRYRDTPRAPKFDLARESDDQLIERLSSPNIYYRETSQRLLRERNDPKTLSKLEALVIDDHFNKKGRMHALWTLIGTGRLESRLHELLLEDRDPTFRAWAVRAAGNFKKVDPVIVKAVLKLADDPSPDVRVQVAIACRKLERLDSLPVLYEIITKGADDPLIPPIVWQNLHPLLETRADDFVTLLSGTSLERSPRLTAILPRVIERLLGGSKPRPEPAIAVLSRLLAARPEGEVLERRRGGHWKS